MLRAPPVDCVPGGGGPIPIIESPRPPGQPRASVRSASYDQPRSTASSDGVVRLSFTAPAFHPTRHAAGPLGRRRAETRRGPRDGRGARREGAGERPVARAETRGHRRWSRRCRGEDRGEGRSAGPCESTGTGPGEAPGRGPRLRPRRGPGIGRGEGPGIGRCEGPAEGPASTGPWPGRGGACAPLRTRVSRGSPGLLRAPAVDRGLLLPSGRGRRLLPLGPRGERSGHRLRRPGVCGDVQAHRALVASGIARARLARCSRAARAPPERGSRAGGGHFALLGCRSRAVWAPLARLSGFCAGLRRRLGRTHRHGPGLSSDQHGVSVVSSHAVARFPEHPWSCRPPRKAGATANAES